MSYSCRARHTKQKSSWKTSIFVGSISCANATKCGFRVWGNWRASTTVVKIWTGSLLERMDLQQMLQVVFDEKYPSLEPIYHWIVNFDCTPFEEALLYFIRIKEIVMTLHKSSYVSWRPSNNAALDVCVTACGSWHYLLYRGTYVHMYWLLPIYYYDSIWFISVYRMTFMHGGARPYVVHCMLK